MPASSVIIDRELVRRREIEEQDALRSISQATEKETTKNVFQRLG